MNSEPQPQHSNFIGGSNAAARIACPASYSLQRKLPVSTKDESSDYADEGSALHAAIGEILDTDVDPVTLIGKRYEGYENFPITLALIDEALQPCLDFFDALDEELGGIEFRVENRVSIPAIPGVFGTADLIGKAPKCSIVGDWKFGAGVQVYAWYEADNGDIEPNEQLMFYLLGATLTFPEMFNMADANWPIELFVAQPRFRDGPNFDRIRVTMEDLWRFEAKLLKAAHEAKGANPSMSKGSWCRFMSCKTICPLHTGPLLDASAIGEMLAKAQMKNHLEASVVQETGLAMAFTDIDWGETYSKMLQLATLIEPVLKDWRAQAHTYLEEGGVVPGYKLVDKRAARKWVKPDASVERKLARLGLTKDERMPRQLVSAPEAEKLLKKHDQKLPKGYFDAISSGLTLAPDGDPRQPREPVGDVIASLTNALAAITQWDHEPQA